MIETERTEVMVAIEVVMTEEEEKREVMEMTDSVGREETETKSEFSRQNTLFKSQKNQFITKIFDVPVFL